MLLTLILLAAQDNLPPLIPTSELPPCTRPMTVSPCQVNGVRHGKFTGPRPPMKPSPLCSETVTVNCRHESEQMSSCEPGRKEKAEKPASTPETPGKDKGWGFYLPLLLILPLVWFTRKMATN